MTAKPISENLSIGDYVCAQGKVKMPSIQSPFFNKRCTYWKTFIWASFESKRKKPEKGMQEHSPLLQVNESDKPPMLIAQQNRLINVDFSDIASLVINLERSESREKKPPNDEVEKLAKDKYKAYRIHEYRMPVDANVVAWGKVDSINKKVINVVRPKNNRSPCFLYLGRNTDIYMKLLRRLTLSLATILASALFLLFLDSLLKLEVIGIAIGAAAIGYLQYSARHKLFELK